MIEPDRVLRPLREAESAIERLDTYESPAALTEALRATWHGVERTLRTLLRSDATVPEDVRLTALSAEQMSVDTVLTELRRRDLISLGLAGRVHELRQTLERSERGDVRAADADIALDVVRLLTGEVQGVARRAAAARGAPEPRAPAAAEDEFDEADIVGFRRSIGLPRRPLLLAGGALIVLIAAIIAVLLLGGESELERGVAAFRGDDYATAERHFRAALDENESDNTARLYLARILRSDGRLEEAQQVLREAGESAPQDGAVRRELGYLLLDVDRAALAAEQFHRAVELDPDEPLNWVGLIESLTRAGDPAAAAEWLRRAPESAQAMVRQRRTLPRSP